MCVPFHPKAYGLALPHVFRPRNGGITHSLSAACSVLDPNIKLEANQHCRFLRIRLLKAQNKWQTILWLVFHLMYFNDVELNALLLLWQQCYQNLSACLFRPVNLIVPHSVIAEKSVIKHTCWSLMLKIVACFHESAL